MKVGGLAGGARFGVQWKLGLIIFLKQYFTPRSARSAQRPTRTRLGWSGEDQSTLALST